MSRRLTAVEIEANAAAAAERHRGGASLAEIFALAPPLRVFPKWSPKPNTIDYDIDREDLYQWILAVKKALGPYQCDRCDARKGELWSDDEHTWPEHCVNCGDEWPDESCFLTKEAGVFHCCECHHTWRADGGEVGPLLPIDVSDAPDGTVLELKFRGSSRVLRAVVSKEKP